MRTIAQRLLRSAFCSLNCKEHKHVCTELCHVSSPTSYCAYVAPDVLMRRASSSDVQASTSAGASARGDVHAHSTKPKGIGFGFDKRFKSMSDEELEHLLENAPRQKSKLGRILLPKPKLTFEGEHEHQYSRTTEAILHPYSRPKSLQEAFAVVEAGHTQFKVVQDDKIFVHKLAGVDINDIIRLERVLLAGTPSDTLIGRPFVPGMYVRAAVEEHIRDAKVYIYKRRRAKGYRRFRGFRAELTALRILEIRGAEQHGVEVPRLCPPDTRTEREIERQRRREARREVKERLNVVKPRDRSFHASERRELLLESRLDAQQAAEMREVVALELAAFLGLDFDELAAARVVSRWPLSAGPWEEELAGQRPELDGEKWRDVRECVAGVLRDPEVLAWRDEFRRSDQDESLDCRDMLAALLHSDAMLTRLGDDGREHEGADGEDVGNDQVEEQVELEYTWRDAIKTLQLRLQSAD